MMLAVTTQPLRQQEFPYLQSQFTDRERSCRLTMTLISFPISGRTVASLQRVRSMFGTITTQIATRSRYRLSMQIGRLMIRKRVASGRILQEPAAFPEPPMARTMSLRFE